MITVFGWRKPTLEIELVEGGSLLPNTKYYVAAYLKYTPFVYNSVGGQLSDIYEITTTSTKKSIKITHKTYRDITDFADSGSGTTIITSERHCLATGDEIKISTGSYAGTWEVTKIDKDTFSIDTAYVDNVPVQCYTDSVRYNHPPVHEASYQNAGHLMNFYVSPYNPAIYNFLTNHWTSAAYQYNYNTNPCTITSQPTGNAQGQGNIETKRVNSGFLKPVIPYGTIFVRVDGATHTFQEIHDAIVAEGFPLNCLYSSQENVFNLVGTLVFSSSGKVSASGAIITIILGEIGTFSVNHVSGLSFNNCLINLFPKLSQPYTNLSANETVFVSNNSQISISGVQVGNDNYYLATPLISGEEYQTYTNLQTGGTISANIIESKNVLSLGISSLVQSSYGQQIWRNNVIPPMYYTGVNASYNYEPDIYMMENCRIFQVGGYNWHYRFYQYPNHDGSFTIVRFLNIDTDDENNIKKCINNRAANFDARWYRRINFEIRDGDDNPIKGVSITITDGDGNEYTAETDDDGIAYLDVIEQKTVFTEGMGIISNWTNERDTYYSNFKIIIRKDGYETYTMFFEKSTDSTENLLTLKTAKPIRIATDGAVLALSPEEGSSSLLKKL